MVRELGLLNDVYRDVDVTLAERHLLIELSSCAPLTVSDIGSRLLLDKSTASRLVLKAVKKGYAEYFSDESDKRKRRLQLTEKGRRVFDAFESIAFNHTKGALELLSDEEIQRVYQGVALYAKGLHASRVRKKDAALQWTPDDCIEARLRELGLELRPFANEDEGSFYEIFRDVVDSGNQFPYESSALEEFHRQFLSPQSSVYVCCSGSEIVGGFYLRANDSGRSNHIANAAYMVRDTYRNKGIGSLLVKASLHLAKQFGFRAMQFNMVLSQNAIAIKFYQKLGFQILATIPDAIRNPDGSYQDGYVMYLKLEGGVI